MESSVPPGSVHGFRDSEEVCIGGTEDSGRDVRMELVFNIEGGLVMECFVGEKEDFEFYMVGDGKPVKVL